ncbi:MAG: tetratricopeptide repeat protein [Pirellulales bacterium]
MSFAMNYELHGFWLPGYHGVNIGIHCLAAVVLYLLVRRVLQQSGGPLTQGAAGGWIGLLCAAVWLAHPLQTGSVTYVVQRFESLMSLFILITLYTLLRTDITTSTRYLWMSACVFASVLATFSKEVAIVLPVVAVAFDRIYLATNWRELLRRRGALHGAMAAVSVWAVYLSRTLLDQNSGISAGFGNKAITPWQYLSSQPGVLLHYLKLSFWPNHLCLDYSWPVARSPWEIYPAGLVILALLGITLWALWRHPKVGFLGLAFFVILAPTSSFVPLLDLAFEHRMYLPLASIVLLAILGSHWCLEKMKANIPYQRGVLAGCALAVLATLGGRTIARNEDYSSAVRMWKSVVAANPASHRAHLMLAANLINQGMLDEAEKHLRIALKIEPAFYEAHISMGSIRIRQGQFDEAERWIRVGLTSDRTVQVAHANLGRLRERQGRMDESLEHYRLAVAADSQYLKAWEALARIAESEGQDYDASRALRRILELDPLEEDAAPRLISLMAKSDDPRVRDVSQALRLAEELNRDRKGRDRLALEALATAQWAHGDRSKALDSLNNALKCPGDSTSRQRIHKLRTQIAKATDSGGMPTETARESERPPRAIR